MGMGNPRWLREAMEAMAQQRRLLNVAGFDWRGLGMTFREDEDGNIQVDPSQLTEEERTLVDRMTS